jgi:energy-coupling factor transport system permease protein
MSLGTARLPRDLHPVAWWCWALGLAVAASSTTNPLVLLMVVGVAATAVALRRSDQPWADSFRLYVVLGVVIVLVRVAFRLLLGTGVPGVVLIDLPAVQLPDVAAGIVLLGPITRESLLAGLYEGLRLAAIVISVGAANALANPKRLLRSVPPALYEVGTALVVAVTMLPQFADSARRVRAAQSLRGGASGRVRGLRRFLVPVLEDALERSLAMAAGMDARGYGRAGAASRAQRSRTGALMLAGLIGVCVGTYAVLDPTAPRWLALPMLLGGLAVAGLGLVSAGARVQRTRYRPDRWRWPELVVVAGGLVAAYAGWWVAHDQLTLAYPALDEVPQVSALSLVALAIALAAALCAPDQRRAVGA